MTMQRLERRLMDETRERDLAPRKERKAYTPPSVTKVPLRPEEAVLGFCKNNVTAGPRGGGGNACVAVGACSINGS